MAVLAVVTAPGAAGTNCDCHTSAGYPLLTPGSIAHVFAKSQPAPVKVDWVFMAAVVSPVPLPPDCPDVCVSQKLLLTDPELLPIRPPVLLPPLTLPVL